MRLCSFPSLSWNCSTSATNLLQMCSSRSNQLKRGHCRVLNASLSKQSPFRMDQWCRQWMCPCPTVRATLLLSTGSSTSPDRHCTILFFVVCLINTKVAAKPFRYTCLVLVHSCSLEDLIPTTLMAQSPEFNAWRNTIGCLMHSLSASVNMALTSRRCWKDLFRLGWISNRDTSLYLNGFSNPSKQRWWNSAFPARQILNNA